MSIFAVGMKRYAAIFFAVAYLLATTSLVEVMKLPILVDHFVGHEQDLITFMVHHYGGHEVDEDWEEDMKLPFMADSALMFMVFNLPDSKLSLKPKASPFAPKKRVFWDDADVTSSYLSGIFQPPRAC